MVPEFFHNFEKLFGVCLAKQEENYQRKVSKVR
jgi:hypothetical protein